MRDSLRAERAFFLALLGLMMGVVSCSGPTDSPAVFRLVDGFKGEMVSGAPATVRPPEPLALWDFGAPVEGKELAGNLGWQVGDGVAGVAVRKGRLSGKARTDYPIVYTRRTENLDDNDLLHSVEIQMRASRGTELRISTAGPEDPEFDDIIAQARVFPWPDATPILAGEDFQTYTIMVSRSTPASRAHHLLISPTDVAGAEFEIGSVRMVSRKEHLTTIPSGVSWQGLSEIYRESLVSRSPESIEVSLQLPTRPWFDLGIGTPEDGSVTFSIHLDDGSGNQRRLLRRTLTTPHRWESAPLDLEEYSGRRVTLRLSLAAEEEGRLGFWGNPVLRSRGHLPGGTRTGTQLPQGVILIIADTLRSDHLNFHGYRRETAPFLGRLASEDALFKNTIAQATWTKVSVPSIMTSLYPTSHRVVDFRDRLPASAVTLAEVFREAGYATLGYSSVFFSGKFTNLHQGYEELHEFGSTSREKPSKTAREYVDRLTEWLEVHREVPFFVFLHVFDPHSPYEPRRPYNSMWADLSLKEEHEEQLESVRKVIKNPLLKRHGMPARNEVVEAGFDPQKYVDYDMDWYDGSIREMDREVARLVERLRELELADRTLLLFTSDHGEEFHDHGRMFHGQSVYGELNRVPLVMHLPGRIPAGIIVDETVQSIDIMPTILELAGLSPPPGIPGRTLVPLLNSKDSGPPEAGEDGWITRPAITERNLTGDSAGAPPPRDVGATSIIFEGWKLIVSSRKGSDEAPGVELFRQADDPLDQKDLAEQHPEVVSRLQGLLEEWRLEALATRLPEAESTEGMSQEDLQRLKSLGYIQ